MDAMVGAEAQMELVKGLCQGKEECTVQSCNEFFGMEIQCSSLDPGYVWFHYR